MISTLAEAPPISRRAPARRGWNPRLRPIIFTTLIGLIVAGSRLSQSWPARESTRLEFDIVSPKPFLQEIPRRRGLIVVHPDGSREALVSQKYVSSFLEQTSTLYFDIADAKATRFFFSPAPPGELVAITGVRAVPHATWRKTDIPLAAFSAVQQVEMLAKETDRLVLKSLPGTSIPLLGFEIPPRPAASLRASVVAILDAVAFFGCTVAICSGIFWAARRRQWLANLRSLNLIRCLPFLAAIGLIFFMAMRSRFNAHPDEYLHFEGANYFVSHWLPPALDHPAVEPSFSHYGVSYLQNLDSAYFAMGKFIAVLPWWTLSRQEAARLFNVVLFTALAGWLLSRLRNSFAAAVLLMTPQVWYIFSYVNGDAWALALSLVMVALLADERSLISRYLVAPDRVPTAGGIALGTFFALLLTVKHNYRVLFGFALLVMIWKVFVWSAPAAPRLLIRKSLVVVGTAAALFLPLWFAQQNANRFDLARLKTVQAEKFAATKFKASAISAGAGSPQIAMRKQGVSFFGLLTTHAWPARTFESFCGVYHWMSLPGPPWYYGVMAGLYALFLIALGIGLRHLPRGDLLFCGATFLLALGLVLLSAYHSWVSDFQPQGRYLFPILPMLAFLLYRYRQSMPTRAFNVLFASLFACAAFSFGFTGLRYFCS
ncbi:MAG TPA: hypothetical protein VJ719_16130 [Chthoniobacterales bacterium]|nr:hypothetical protein [Chthoniobacterales bacterium]